MINKRKDDFIVINYIADKYFDYIYKKGKVNFKRGSSEWSDFDYKLRCNLFNYGSLLIIVLLNTFTHSWLEFLIIVTVFNVMRNFTEGIHAKVLSFCTLFSTCYFTILSVITHRIIHSDGLFLYYSLPFLAILGSIYVYRYIPKHNINSEESELINTDNNEEMLTIDEKKQAYRYFIIGFSIIMIGSLFLFHAKFIPISISVGLISLQGILSNIGEKVFNFIQDIYIEKLIKRGN